MNNKPKLLLVLLFLLYCSGFAGTKHAVKMVKSFDGVTIRYIVEGSGTPALVFIHGWNMNSSYWENQIDYFSPNFKIIAIDLAGYGNSSKEREDYTMQAFGHDVKAVVENENLEEVILIGHSMGGAVAIEAAALLGEKVLGIVGADTFQDLSARYEGIQLESILNPYKNNYENHCPTFVKSIFGANTKQELVEATVKDMCDEEHRIAYSAIKNLFTYYPVPTLAKIEKPIITINTDFFPVSVEKNKSVTNSFELKLMSNVGHFVMIEDPETFNALLTESIAEIILK